MNHSVTLNDAYKSFTRDQDKILHPKETVKRFKEKLNTMDLDILKRLKARGKLRFTPKAKVKVSTRRVKGWGYRKFLWHHITNAWKYVTTGKSHDDYERVR